MGGQEIGEQRLGAYLWFSLAQLGSQGVESEQVPLWGLASYFFLETQGDPGASTCRRGTEGVWRREPAFAILITACDRQTATCPGPQHGPTVILLSHVDLSHRIRFLLTSARQYTHTHTHTHTLACFSCLHMQRELLENCHRRPWLTFHPSSSEKTILHHYVLSSDLRERCTGREIQEPRKCPALRAGTSTKVLNPHYDSARIRCLGVADGKTEACGWVDTTCPRPHCQKVEKMALAHACQLCRPGLT